MRLPQRAADAVVAPGRVDSRPRAGLDVGRIGRDPARTAVAAGRQRSPAGRMHEQPPRAAVHRAVAVAPDDQSVQYRPQLATGGREVELGPIRAITEGRRGFDQGWSSSNRVAIA